jgi:hypothetical protein
MQPNYSLPLAGVGLEERMIVSCKTLGKRIDSYRTRQKNEVSNRNGQ